MTVLRHFFPPLEGYLSAAIGLLFYFCTLDQLPIFIMHIVIFVQDSLASFTVL